MVPCLVLTAGLRPCLPTVIQSFGQTLFNTFRAIMGAMEGHVACDPGGLPEGNDI